MRLSLLLLVLGLALLIGGLALVSVPGALMLSGCGLVVVALFLNVPVRGRR